MDLSASNSFAFQLWARKRGKRWSVGHSKNDSHDQKIIRELFRALDVNNSGVIEISELEYAFRALNLDFTEKELKSLMSQLDIDGNGELNLAEFARAMTTSYRLNSLNLQVLSSDLPTQKELGKSNSETSPPQATSTHNSPKSKTTKTVIPFHMIVHAFRRRRALNTLFETGKVSVDFMPQEFSEGGMIDPALATDANAASKRLAKIDTIFRFLPRKIATKILEVHDDTNEVKEREVSPQEAKESKMSIMSSKNHNVRFFSEDNTEEIESETMQRIQTVMKNIKSMYKSMQRSRAAQARASTQSNRSTLRSGTNSNIDSDGRVSSVVRGSTAIGTPDEYVDAGALGMDSGLLELLDSLGILEDSADLPEWEQAMLAAMRQQGLVDDNSMPRHVADPALLDTEDRQQIKYLASVLTAMHIMASGKGAPSVTTATQVRSLTLIRSLDRISSLFSQNVTTSAQKKREQKLREQRDRMLDSRSPRLSVGRSRDSKNRSSAYDHAIEATMVAMEAKRYAISSPKSQLAYTRAVNEEFMREQKQWREKARRKSLGLLLDQSKRQPSQVDKHEHLNGEYDPMSMIEQMIKSCMLSSRPNQSSQTTSVDAPSCCSDKWQKCCMHTSAQMASKRAAVLSIIQESEKLGDKEAKSKAESLKQVKRSKGEMDVFLSAMDESKLTTFQKLDAKTRSKPIKGLSNIRFTKSTELDRSVQAPKPTLVHASLSSLSFANGSVVNKASVCSTLEAKSILSSKHKENDFGQSIGDQEVRLSVLSCPVVLHESDGKSERHMPSVLRKLLKKDGSDLTRENTLQEGELQNRFQDECPDNTVESSISCDKQLTSCRKHVKIDVIDESHASHGVLVVYDSPQKNITKCPSEHFTNQSETEYLDVKWKRKKLSQGGYSRVRPIINLASKTKEDKQANAHSTIKCPIPPPCPPKHRAGLTRPHQNRILKNTLQVQTSTEADTKQGASFFLTEFSQEMNLNTFPTLTTSSKLSINTQDLHNVERIQDNQHSNHKKQSTCARSSSFSVFVPHLDSCGTKIITSPTYNTQTSLPTSSSKLQDSCNEAHLSAGSGLIDRCIEHEQSGKASQLPPQAQGKSTEPFTATSNVYGSNSDQLDKGNPNKGNTRPHRSERPFMSGWSIESKSNSQSATGTLDPLYAYPLPMSPREALISQQHRYSPSKESALSQAGMAQISGKSVLKQLPNLPNLWN